MLISLILAGVFLGIALSLAMISLRQRARIKRLVLDTTILSRVCDLSADGASSLVLTPEGKLFRDWARSPVFDTLGIDFTHINDFESFLKIVFPDDLPQVKAELEKLMTGQQVSCVFRVRDMDGGLRWLKHSVVPEQDLNTGRIVRLISVAQDITAEQEALDILRRIERRYDEMFRNSLDCIFIVRLDKTGNFIYENSNPQHERATGVSATNLIGRTPHECFPPKIAEHFIKNYTHCLETDGPVSYEEEIEFSSGYQAALTLLVPLRNENRKIESIIGFSRVITQRKLAEEELRKSQEKYQNIFEESPVGIFQSSASGRFLSVNPEMARIFGYDNPAEMVGKITDISSQFYVSPKDRERFLRRVTESGVSLAEELFLRKKDGTTFPGRLIIKAVHDVDGGVHHFFGHLEDRTRISRIEEEKNTLQEQLHHVQRVEAVGRLAAAVAHDFNNLLSPILGYAELLLSEPACQDWKEELDLIRDSASRAAGIARQLLTFSRKQPVHLADASASTIVKNFLPLLKQTGGEDVEFVLTLPETEAPIYADVLQIEQVLLNLTLNAVDAMQGKGRIGLTVEDEGKYVVIRISDTGCGFDAETKKKIFEPFYTTKQPGTGTGLGLPIINNIIEQHGGYLHVESTPGQGSTFSIFLPAVSKPVLEGATNPEERRDPANLSGASVVVVDDDGTVIEFVRTVLTRAGYRVQAYKDSSQALSDFESGMSADLVITDVMMPGIDGATLAKRIQELLPRVPLLFISGYADTLLMKRGQLVSWSEFLQKPFSVKDLLGVVARLLAVNQAGR